MGLLAALVVTPAIAAGRADSLAAFARSQYGGAMVALRAGDIALAREKLVQAAMAWPA
jgi:hypothetical protein